MAAYYVVKAQKRACRIDIRTRNDTAAQVILGWAGGGSAGMELYGRTTGGASTWKLSPAAVRELRRGIRQQVSQRERFKVSPRENRAAVELEVKLRQEAKKLSSCGASFGRHKRRRR